MDLSAALPTFVITLREGVEAALVVGIVLACLRKAGAERLNGWVWGGVAAGLGVSAVVGSLFGLLPALGGEAVGQKYATAFEPMLECVFGVLAIAMLSWMLLWMTRQARALKGQVESSVQRAIEADGSGWALFGLVLFAVLREGFETVLFIASRFSEGPVPVLGAFLGICAAVVIALLLFQWGVRIDLRRFFQAMGILLILVVAGLVVTSVGRLDDAVQALAGVDRASESLCFFREAFVRNPSCILGPGVWDASRVLPEDRFPGIVLSALFGYTARLYLVQAIGYVLFLATVGTLYWQSLSGRSLFSVKVLSRGLSGRNDHL